MSPKNRLKKSSPKNSRKGESGDEKGWRGIPCTNWVVEIFTTQCFTSLASPEKEGGLCPRNQQRPVVYPALPRSRRPCMVTKHHSLILLYPLRYWISCRCLHSYLPCAPWPIIKSAKAFLSASERAFVFSIALFIMFPSAGFTIGTASPFRYLIN